MAYSLFATPYMSVCICLKEGTDCIYTYLLVTIGFNGMSMTSQEAIDFCLTMTDEQEEAAREMLERVAAKWPLHVLQVLEAARGPLRFSRLLERVGGISQKVLTQTLRTLERDRLVTRTLYPQVPPR